MSGKGEKAGTGKGNDAVRPRVGGLAGGDDKAGAAKPAESVQPVKPTPPAAKPQASVAETAKPAAPAPLAAAPTKAEPSKAEPVKPAPPPTPAPVAAAPKPQAPAAETAKPAAPAPSAAAPTKPEPPKAEPVKPAPPPTPAPVAAAAKPQAPAAETAKPAAPLASPPAAAPAPSAAAPTKPEPPKAEPVKPAPPPTPAPVAAAAKPQAAAAETAKPAAAQPPKLDPVPHSILAPDGDVGALLAAEHGDPFAFLGMHVVEPGKRVVVRALMPKVTAVTVIDAASGAVVGVLDKVRAEGLFAGPVAARADAPGKPFPYRLRLGGEDGEREIDDAYRFPPLLSDADVRRLTQGELPRSYEKLGAHPTTIDGVAGTAFAVWAPNASRVAVIGPFNDWDGRCHGMRRRHECGAWEIFIPGVAAGELYKFEIKTGSGERLADKCDPYAFEVERGPGAAAVVADLNRHAWGDRAWMDRRRAFEAREQPVAIYEVHLGSWRRKPEEGHRWLTYRELAEELPPYVADLGFTHVELLPVNESDFDPSLGYQPFVPYAPTNHWGSAEGFAELVDRFHQAGVGVILDWVPNHFSDNPHGLREFDGTTLYEAADPQRRRNPGSSALVYEYGRREVANYLISNAFYWFDRFHVDALRIAHLPAMLYLDYQRGHGEWTPNQFGGHENLEAVEFIHRFNEQVYKAFPGIFTVAEDSSAWPRVSHPVFLGGLGFGFRWNAPWAHDTLRYLARNPVHRKYYHDELTYGPSTAFQENFVLPLSHDEVAFGKGSLLHRMSGDTWQKFANLRAYYGLMYGHPGKKLLFMGDEFAQDREWNSDISLDWHLLDQGMHRGVHQLMRDLNALYRSAPALHQLDCEADGFAWIDCNDSDQSVISFLRQARDGKGTVVVVSNFTPVIRNDYRVGVPEPGFYEERLNTDAEAYGGTNTGSAGGVTAMAEGMHGRPYCLSLRLPPFSTVFLQHRGE